MDTEQIIERGRSAPLVPPSIGAAVETDSPSGPSPMRAPAPNLLVAEPILGDEEKDAVRTVLDGGWITMGQKVRAFEEAFAHAHDVEDAVAVNSCTAALHLILDALGIGPGDEVLVPSLTFVATANAVLYVGAKPVFVDIAALDTPLISMSDADAKVNSRTRAIILMHYAGYLTHAEDWRNFADLHDLVIIEDAAHAVGARGVGHVGDATAFSFYGNKNMTTAEGGMVTAANPAVLAKVRQMRGHGMTLDMRQRLNGRTPHYDVSMLGYNYRMDELRAAIGLVQLAHLPAWNARRRALTSSYRHELARNCPDIGVPFFESAISANHIMPVVLPAGTDRDAVIARLAGEGIQTTIHYPPVHTLSYYASRFRAVRLPVTEEFAACELSLPLHPRMQATDVERVVFSLAGALKHS